MPCAPRSCFLTASARTKICAAIANAAHAAAILGTEDLSCLCTKTTRTSPFYNEFCPQKNPQNVEKGLDYQDLTSTEIDMAPGLTVVEEGGTASAIAMVCCSPIRRSGVILMFGGQFVFLLHK